MKSKAITLEFSKAEAIVLFEFLARGNDINIFVIEDQSEQRVLWNIECMLEKALVAPFDSNYSNILSQAREEVRDSEYYPSNS